MKKVIAREWLILLFFIFFGPPLIALYQWISAPASRGNGSLDRPLSWFFDGALYEPVFDKTATEPKLRWFRRSGANIAFRALSERNAVEIENVFRESLDKNQLREYIFIGETGNEPAKTKLDDDLQSAFIAAKRGADLTDDEIGILGMAGVVNYRKRSIWSYVADVSSNLQAYVIVFFSYPLFLFVRSIVWSIRILRHKRTA